VKIEDEICAILEAGLQAVIVEINKKIPDFSDPLKFD